MTISKSAAVLAALAPVLAIGAMAIETGFEHVCSWDAYDPGAHGIGYDPDGYHGAVFDGRYIYFVPYINGGSHFHGEVLRFDTLGNFADAASWTTYDPGAHGVGRYAEGYASGIFDGRYVYFVPWANNTTGYHGEVLRYDTAGDFADASSWAAFDAGAHGVGSDPDGYRGAVFDGQYVYFVPTYNGAQFHGEVLRLDTTGDFSDVSAWATFDPGNHGVGVDPDGYSYASFDGRYIYFGPYLNGSAYHGEVLRYDTAGDFFDAASWATYDPGRHGVGNDPDGYPGTVFDGRYVYFVPFNNGTDYHGEVLRYDTTADFFDAKSWATFDAAAHGVGVDPTGYCGGVFDGRYIYFVPFYHGENHDEVLRYDSLGDFSDVSSWTAYNPAMGGVGAENHGYREGTFDGRYVYFAPCSAYVAHGEVLRFDTATCPGDLDHDADIDLADLAQLLGRYGTTGSATCDDGDLDGDGDVDLGDLAVLLSVYGTDCP